MHFQKNLVGFFCVLGIRLHQVYRAFLDLCICTFVILQLMSTLLLVCIGEVKFCSTLYTLTDFYSACSVSYLEMRLFLIILEICLFFFRLSSYASYVETILLIHIKLEMSVFGWINLLL